MTGLLSYYEDAKPARKLQIAHACLLCMRVSCACTSLTKPGPGEGGTVAQSCCLQAWSGIPSPHSMNGEGPAATAVVSDQFKLFFFFLISIWFDSGNQDRGGDSPAGSTDLGGILLGEMGEADVLGAMIGSLGLILLTARWKNCVGGRSEEVKSSPPFSQ